MRQKSCRVRFPNPPDSHRIYYVGKRKTRKGEAPIGAFSLFMTFGFFTTVLIAAAILAVLWILLLSFYSIGPTQVGLVRKRFGAKLPGDSPVAFNGEAGYQADMLMPGLRFQFILVYAVSKHPWVQVPAGQIGVVISQI